MAVFDQRAELNRQKKHIAPQWDNDVLNKVLGFNEKGERNAWGKIVVGNVPGLNTATHAIAKTRAGGSTKDVLNETFDEAVGKDMAGLALGVSAAKTFLTGGAGAGLGMASKAGEAASGVGGMFSGGGKMADIFSNMGIGKGAGGEGMTNELANNLMEGQDVAPSKKGFGFNLGNPEEGEGLGGMFDSFNKQVNDVQMENMKNPYESGTPEYNKFEEMLDKKQKENNKGAFAEGIKGVGKNIAGGNIFEAGANYAGSLVANKMATKDAVKKASRGNFAYNPEFNYL